MAILDLSIGILANTRQQNQYLSEKYIEKYNRYKQRPNKMTQNLLSLAGSLQKKDNIVLVIFPFCFKMDINILVGKGI